MAAKILLVDDEPAQLELLRYNLEKAGFETIQSENGRDAILLTEEHEPDMVVLDWMMPEASGIDVCANCARAETRLLPILMVSARGKKAARLGWIRAMTRLKAVSARTVARVKACCVRRVRLYCRMCCSFTG